MRSIREPRPVSLRGAVAAGVFALAASLLLAAGAASPARAGGAARVHGVPLPRGSHRLDKDLYESGRGFRKTVTHFERFLRRRGLRHKAVPVYRRRGVAVARFLSRQPDSKWQAIHVFRTRGRTRVAIVPRPLPLTDPPSHAKNPRSDAN